jgi:shikimate kinase
MEHIKKSGVVVYMDVFTEDILKRLSEMKVDRIVGQGSMQMDSILRYRTTFYEKYYDIRALMPPSIS